MFNSSSYRRIITWVGGGAVALLAGLLALDLSVTASGPTRYQHDKKGRLIKHISPNGKVINYHYNKAGQIQEISYHRRGFISKLEYTDEDSAEFNYDPAGNRTRMQDGHGKTSYKYDEFNRLTEVTHPEAKTLTYSYNPWNQIKKIGLPGGRALTYQYNIFGHVSSVSDGGASVLYSYDGDTNEVRRRLPNGIMTIFQSSPTKGLSQIRHLNADGSLIASYRYEHDAEGRVTLVEESGGGGSTVKRYQYDAMGRLLKVIDPDGAEIKYEYDLMGNRKSEDDRGTTRYEYDSKGRLVKAGEATFKYDEAGNLISKSDRSKRTSYAYDAENRLVEVRTGGKKIRYTYDAEGNRVRREVNGKVINYINDNTCGAQQVLAEYGKEGKLSYYLLGHSRVGRRDADGAALFYLEDHLGSTRLVVDESGKVAARYSYSPFGLPKLVEGKHSTSFLYAGEQYDEEAGLIYLRARFYDPAIGRFLTADPLPGVAMAPETFNPYVYVNNDPVNRIDPMGLQSWPPSPTNNEWWRHIPPPPQPLPPPPPRPTPVFDPNRHRPVIVESWQKWWENYGVDQLTRNPHGMGGRMAAAFSSFEYAMLEYFAKPYEIKLRQLSDMTYLREHPFRYMGAGAELAIDFASRLPIKQGLSVTFRGGVALRDRIGIYAVNDSWASNRIFLPYIDSRYPSSRTLKVPFEKMFQLYELGGASYDLIERLSAFPQVRQFVRDAAEASMRYNTMANILYPFGLSRRENIFFPPPGGGGGDMPSVGGVYLDQAASIIGEIGSITGAMYDPASGQIVLVGDKSASLPPMKPEYLAAAIRAVYTDTPHEPGMTIDPNPQNPLGPVMDVKFFGNTENTRLGWVMFEADRLMKGYSIGRDNVTKQPVECSVPGYESVTAMGLREGGVNSGLWSRFWLVPEPVTGQVSDDGRAIIFDPIKMRVKTETMRWAGGRLVPAGNIKDPHAEAFAENFTAHYEEFAKENPIYSELKQVTQAVALAKWMKQQGIPANWNLVRTFAGQPYATPVTTPSASEKLQRSAGQGSGAQTIIVSSYGGVEMTPELRPQPSPAAKELQTDIMNAWSTARKRGAMRFPIRFKNNQGEAVALPRPDQREPSSYNASEADGGNTCGGDPFINSLPGISRYYSSTHNEATEFGFAWSLLMPRLEFESAHAGRGVQYISLEGDSATQVRVQKYVLTDQFGLVYQRFDKDFIDQSLRRIGFKAERQQSRYRGLYPESDGTYRLIFTNGEEAIFDDKGSLRAIFRPGGKALYEYDAQNRLVAIRISRAGQDNEIRYGYDSQGRLSNCLSCGFGAQYGYDEAGNLGSVNSEGKIIKYRYDDKRLLKEIEIDGKIVAKNSYDEGGRLIKQDGIDGSLDQKVEITPGGKTIVTRQGPDTFKRYYDADDRLTGVEGENGSFKYSRDEEGRISGVDAILPTGGESKVRLSPDEGLVEAEDARGVRTEYRFEPNGKVGEVLVNNDRVASYKYDQNNNVTEIAYKGGTAEKYVYGDGGRLEQYRRVDSSPGDETEQTLTYSYDEKGELVGIGGQRVPPVKVSSQPQAVAVTQGAETRTYHYEPDGRPNRVEQPDGSSLKFDYRPDGVLRGVELSKEGSGRKIERIDDTSIISKNLTGDQTTYSFSPAGLLTSVQDHFGGRTSYLYDNENRLRRVMLANGLCLDYFYDPATGLLREERYNPCKK
ncbi:MAG TPA: RHS repeat-associated core domain-containing protein [Blastocatellia bacterium]|nr:RHS repeat-associated core domain-containing protein [Blastocatellia bacterium]